MKVFNKQTQNTEDLQCSPPPPAAALLSFERAMQTRLDKLRLWPGLNTEIWWGGWAQYENISDWGWGRGLRLKQQTEDWLLSPPSLSSPLSPLSSLHSQIEIITLLDSAELSCLHNWPELLRKSWVIVWIMIPSPTTTTPYCSAEMWAWGQFC